MNRSRGYTLIELLLVLGAIAAGVAGTYGLYHVTMGQHKQEQAIDQVRHVLGRMESAFAATPNYQHLSQQRAMEEGLFGPDAQVVDGRVLLPQLGEVMLSPVDAMVGGQMVEDAGYQIILPELPAGACPLLVGHMGAAAREVEVGGTTLTGAQAQDPAQVAGPCSSSGDTVRVVITMVNAAAGEALSACVAPTDPQEQVVGCGAGKTGQRVQQRTGVCPQPYGEVLWSAWATVSDTCQGCPPPQTETQPCLPGQYGSRQAQRTFDCQSKQWGDWVIITQSCATCPTQPEQRQGACLAGQAGYTVEERVFQCTEGLWGPWVVRERFCT